MSTPDRDALVAALQDLFKRGDERIVAAWLYGSQARGTAGADSDVDVGVLYRDPPAAMTHGGPLDLEGEIERIVRRPVQVVVMNRAPVDLVHRVLRDGILLCERDRGARVRFEVRARNEYFDLLPHLLRYRRRA
jgi:predicted nucleotidyltransferase